MSLPNAVVEIRITTAMVAIRSPYSTTSWPPSSRTNCEASLSAVCILGSLVLLMKDKPPPPRGGGGRLLPLRNGGGNAARQAAGPSNGPGAESRRGQQHNRSH